MKSTGVGFRGASAPQATNVYLILILLISCFSGCTIPGTTGKEPVRESPYKISQFGITWFFDKEYDYGQYANGDYWIVGPVQIVGIDPPSLEVENRMINGSMTNVDPENWRTQGFCDGMEIDYDPSRNCARPNGSKLNVENTLTVPVHSSLLSSITRKPVGGVWPRRPLLDSIAILTVVESAPEEGDFRPSYTGTDKTSHYNIKDMDYSFLPSLTGVEDNPDITEIEDYFERPWIDFVKCWTYRDLAPLNNMPSYGRQYAVQTGMAALTLSLDYTNKEKETLMTRYVQLGLDLYGAMINGMEWHPAGGFFHGRKLPILFAGNVLNSETILNELKILEEQIPFQEDGTTFYVRQEDVERTRNESIWRPNETARARGDVEPYSKTDIGMPEWGVRHNAGNSIVVSTQPESDNRFFNAGYRLINANPGTATVLAAYILGLKEQWNHDVFFDYQDRHVEIVFSKDDSFFIIQ